MGSLDQLVVTEKSPWSEHDEVSGATRPADRERPRRGDILLSESVRPSLGDRVQGSMKRVRNFVQRAERHFSVGTN